MPEPGFLAPPHHGSKPAVHGQQHRPDILQHHSQPPGTDTTTWPCDQSSAASPALTRRIHRPACGREGQRRRASQAPRPARSRCTRQPRAHHQTNPITAATTISSMAISFQHRCQGAGDSAIPTGKGGIFAPRRHQRRLGRRKHMAKRTLVPLMAVNPRRPRRPGGRPGLEQRGTSGSCAGPSVPEHRVVWLARGGVLRSGDGAIAAEGRDYLETVEARLGAVPLGRWFASRADGDRWRRKPSTPIHRADRRAAGWLARSRWRPRRAAPAGSPVPSLVRAA